MAWRLGKTRDRFTVASLGQYEHTCSKNRYSTLLCEKHYIESSDIYFRESRLHSDINRIIRKLLDLQIRHHGRYIFQKT